MSRGWSLIGAVALITVHLAAPGVATACACGGLLSSDPSLRVADELALLTGDGTTETVVMRLNLSTSADNAAFVMPTPTPATVSAAPADLFEDLAELSAPRIETVRKWVIGWGGAAAPDGVMAGAPASGAPTVLGQVRLGPLEATTLSGGDLAGVQKWSADNGYQLRSEISAGLEPYLYTLGEHRMQRADPDAAAQRIDVDYAGSIADRTDNPTLNELAGPGAFLTKMTTSISEPASITSDFAFGPTLTDEPFQRVVYRYEYVNLTLVILGGGAVLVLVSVALVGFWIIRWARRRPTAP